MMKNRILYLLVFCSITICTNAQVKNDLSIVVMNHLKQPLNNATVVLSGSNLADTKVTSRGGNVLFKIVNGTYNAKVVFVGYGTVDKKYKLENQSISDTIQLSLQKKESDVAVVVGKKPLMKQEDDKTIVDAEQLAVSSTNAYEVIEKTPGAIVDQDGNIYLASMQPATIQINGREVRMSAADLQAMLKNLPSSAIVRIEMTKNPNAKADAASTGGIINVVLRKGVKLGINGSVNASHFQGVYGTSSTGFAMNNNNDKSNLNISYNYTTRNSFEQIKTNRQFATDPTFIDQKSYTRYPALTNYISVGYDKDVTKKLNLLLESRVSFNKSFSQGGNETDIKNSVTNLITATSGNKNNNQNSSVYWNTNFSGKYKIDSLGSEWTSSVDYSLSDASTHQAYSNYFSTLGTSTLFGDGAIDGVRNTVLLNSDLKLKVKNRVVLETGAKLTAVNFNNVAEFYRQQGIVVPRSIDARRTNSFQYNERVGALYGQASKTLWKDLVIKAGVRYENTYQQGQQTVPTDTTFSINRGDYFPYLYISKPVVKIMGFELMGNLIARRTISRPVYEQLNPFARFVDQFLTESGNPNLQPQFTNNYEFNISADGRPVISAGYNDTKNIFSQVTYQDDVSKVANRTFDNLGNNKEYYIRFLGAIPPGKKYFFVLGAQYNRSFYEGYYQGAPLNFKQNTWTIFTFHQLKLNKTTSLTMNGFMRTKGVFNFYELDDFGQLSFNLSKSFANNKYNITLAANDVFRTNQYDFRIQQGTVTAFGNRLNDSRRVGLSVRYNFGIKPKEKKKDEDDVMEPKVD
jgi:hypothetical protein